MDDIHRNVIEHHSDVPDTTAAALPIPKQRDCLMSDHFEGTIISAAVSASKYGRLWTEELVIGESQVPFHRIFVVAQFHSSFGFKQLSGPRFRKDNDDHHEEKWINIHFPFNSLPFQFAVRFDTLFKMFVFNIRRSKVWYGFFPVCFQIYFLKTGRVFEKLIDH